MILNLKFGYVCDLHPGEVKVFLQEESMPTDWLPVIRRKSKSDKESWSLEVNEHVACLLDENCNTGICLGAIHSDKDLPDNDESPDKFRKLFSDGTIIEYDKKKSILSGNIKGDISIECSGKAEISTSQDLIGKAGNKAIIQATEVEIIGKLSVNGEVIINGNLNVTGSLTGEGVNLKKHAHGGVQPGGGNTSFPI